MKISRVHHLREASLYDAYLASRGGTAPDPRLAEHLADCASCGRRYAEMAALMDEVALAADADLDDLFPAEQRRVQARRILDRIDHVGRPARVLSFPLRRIGGRMAGTSAPRIATRWIAAGAAAGLFVGVGLGLFLNFDAMRKQAAPVATLRPIHSAPSAPARRSNAAFNSEDDVEAFLSDLDAAAETPQTRVLRGYDMLTPHARDIADIR
jgi:anti-sigma factor RsiW